MKFPENGPPETPAPSQKKNDQLSRRNFIIKAARNSSVLAGVFSLGVGLKKVRDNLVEERERTSIERKHFVVSVIAKHHQNEKFLNPADEYKPAAKFNPLKFRFPESFAVTVDVFGKPFKFNVNKELFTEIQTGDKVEIELEEKYESTLNKETGQFEKILESEEITNLKQL